jgi:hypothetical protein
MEADPTTCFEEFNTLFPLADREALMAEHICDEYRFAKVPKTDVYVFYGIREAAKQIVMLGIRNP